MAGSFVTESVLVPASSYFGLKDSGSLAGTVAPYYTGGLVKYEVFVPDATAAANEFQGAKIPTVCQCHAQGTGEWSGTLASPTGNSGAQTGLPGQPGDKLGRNTTPSNTWPTYGLFYQLTTDWDGLGTNNDTGGTTGLHKHRAGFQIHTAVTQDFLAKYPAADRNRLILTGVSSGGSEGLGYMYAHYKYPLLFPIDYAAFIGVATWVGVTARADLPGEGGQTGTTEDYSLSTIHKVTNALVRLGVPMYFINSAQDSQIGPGTTTTLGYRSMYEAFKRYYPVASVQSLSSPSRDYWDGGKMLQIIEYTTGGPDHNATWPQAYGNHVVGGAGAMAWTDPLWQWAKQHNRLRQTWTRRAA